jgi:hypothetical protein
MEPFATHNILARDLEDHQKVCPFRFVDCPLHRRIEFAQTNWKNLLSCDYRIVTCSYQPGHRMPAIYLEKHEIHAVIYQTAATNQTVMTMMMDQTKLIRVIYATILVQQIVSSLLHTFSLMRM